ncbi:GFA family protein [Marinobacterium aestuariivivens]|uniref:GFA family protein n=1 Tax=Marinobacterium aestuariivivens TaxID=1698799 RepID=A0ABW2A6F5_9GAMM
MLAVECGTDVRFEGEDNIAVYASSDWAERGFCKTCGTHLFYRLKGSGEYAMPAGLFDNGDFMLKSQIFIDEKPGFYSFAEQTRNMTGAEVFAEYGPPPE